MWICHEGSGRAFLSVPPEPLPVMFMYLLLLLHCIAEVRQESYFQYSFPSPTKKTNHSLIVHKTAKFSVLLIHTEVISKAGRP